MLAFLAMLIPGLSGLVTSLSTLYFNSKVAIYRAKTGADQTVAVAAIQAAAQAEHENASRLSIIASNKFLTILLIAMALPLVAFEWKVIVWDKILGLGRTDEITGQVASWAQSIVYFLFGAPTVMGMTKMWYGRKGQ